ncbi:MAG: Bro-N domain-containing protein [Candidatus Cloacimonadota bacterium]|nr:Bro-N domain-containing protein [Candidatus Cloacimonadota bacterium]
MSKQNKIQIFQEQKVRTHWDETLEKWFFSIIDVVAILTEQIDYQGARNYWKVLKHRLVKEGNETVTNCNRLKMPAADGKMRKTDVADTEQIFRLIQSIPSSKAEPFKRWLAKVGYERVLEIEDPELATKRTRALYNAKGYSEDWIKKRMRGITIRDELTEEWQNRGVKEQKEYAILTAEISKATFGMTPSQYKEFKRLKRENLRDHMTDLELIFSMLGERATTEITQTDNSKGFKKLQKDAKDGGKIAGDAKKALEKKTRKSVSSSENYLEVPEKQKKITKKSQ